MPDAGLDIDFDAPPAAPNGISPEADAELAAIQAAATANTAMPPPADDGAVIDGTAQDTQKVTLAGREFRIADKVGLMPLLKFAAFSDMDTQDPRALGAMYAMLRDCIAPDDWRAFEDHACEAKAGADDLLDVITATVGLIAGRPTVPPVSSSPGPRAISGGSTGSSSARRGRASRR